MAVQHADAGSDARPLRRDAVRNHQLVVDAARDVLSEFGTDASMELIAARAGVGVGTVYRRFPNKEALIDELVRLILTELITAAELELAKDEGGGAGAGAGLENFLRVLGRSFDEHRGYADKLIAHTKAACAAHLRSLIGALLTQAQQHGQVRADITLGDVMSTVYSLRGLVASTGAVAPAAWERYLDIHLAGFRSPTAPSSRPSLTADELARIGGASA
ncbi:TetR/AcrR family transcriptional regulator [Streptacidiphilus sp. PAMC 29251]